MNRLPWWGAMMLGVWVVWLAYTAFMTAAMYFDAAHNQRLMQEWVKKYTQEHHVTVAELRAVKDPFKGYLNEPQTREESEYYQAAMYAQNIAEWRPLRAGMVMFGSWAFQWLLIPGIGVAVWARLRRRDSRVLPELRP